MEVKIGNIEMKMPIDELFGKFGAGFNPFESMFSKFSPGLFNEMYKDYQKMFTHQYEEFAKQMKKYSKTGKEE